MNWNTYTTASDYYLIEDWEQLTPCMDHILYTVRDYQGGAPIEAVWLFGHEAWRELCRQYQELRDRMRISVKLPPLGEHALNGMAIEYSGIPCYLDHNIEPRAVRLAPKPRYVKWRTGDPVVIDPSLWRRKVEMACKAYHALPSPDGLQGPAWGDWTEDEREEARARMAVALRAAGEEMISW